MPFTAAQLTALKTDLVNDATLLQQAENGDYNGVADAYNAAANPAFWCWRTSVAKSEYVSSTSGDSTVFSWTSYIGRSQGERDAWKELFNGKETCNPSLANVQQAFADIFSGAGGAGNRTHLSAISRRKATRCEKVLATGTGSTASPGQFTFQGTMEPSDVGAILSA